MKLCSGKSSIARRSTVSNWQNYQHFQLNRVHPVPEQDSRVPEWVCRARDSVGVAMDILRGKHLLVGALAGRRTQELEVTIRSTMHAIAISDADFAIMAQGSFF